MGGLGHGTSKHAFFQAFLTPHESKNHTYSMQYAIRVGGLTPLASRHSATSCSLIFTPPLLSFHFDHWTPDRMAYLDSRHNATIFLE